MKKHGNSRENDALHHLYEIYDKEREDVYKYGICGDPLRRDGSSPRAKVQLRDFNRVAGWFRFLATVIVKNIPGRAKALEIEDQYIAEYEAKNGSKPPGNQ